MAPSVFAPESSSIANILHELENSHSHEDHSSTNSNGLNTNGKRPAKQRAGLACDTCRSRKVRCDVTINDPCTNCVQSKDSSCPISEGKRRKPTANAPPKQKTTTKERRELGILANRSKEENGKARPHTPNGNVPGMTNSQSREGNANANYFMNSAESPVYGSQGYSPNSLLQESPQPHVSHSLYQSQNHRSYNESSNVNIFTQGDSPSYLTDQSPYQQSGSSEVHTPPVLPSYIKAIPARINKNAIRFLQQEGAFAIPEHRLRNALLQAYVEFVHPYMPLIDLHEFFSIMNDDGESGKISLILFQAIMFAGSTFVGLEYLLAAGFGTRMEARRFYHSKAKYLYEFDYDNDRLALVQSLLLMTYWYETPDDQKDTWHWMGLATSIAYTIGLHRNSENSRLSPKDKTLRKRVWWCCYMRDHLIALGMRRPTRIKEDDCNVPMLTLEDFETQPLPDNINILSLSCKLVRSEELLTTLAVYCIEMAELSKLLSDVLHSQYSTKYSVRLETNLEEKNTKSATMIFPHKDDEKVGKCDADLQNWFRRLPQECRYQPPSTKMIESGQATACVQNALLNLVYYTTLSALHRPQVLPGLESKKQPQPLPQQDISRKKVREASKRITLITASLDSYGLWKYLPTTGTTVILPAIIIHMLDIKSKTSDLRREAQRDFNICFRVLWKLRALYSAAEFAANFLKSAILKVGIDVREGREEEGYIDDGVDIGYPRPNPNRRDMKLEFMKGMGGILKMRTPPPEFGSANGNMNGSARPEPYWELGAGGEKKAITTPDSDEIMHGDTEADIGLGINLPQSPTILFPEGQSFDDLLNPNAIANGTTLDSAAMSPFTAQINNSLSQQETLVQEEHQLTNDEIFEHFNFDADPGTFEFGDFGETGMAMEGMEWDGEDAWGTPEKINGETAIDAGEAMTYSDTRMPGTEELE